jgi:hypothetical protein
METSTTVKVTEKDYYNQIKVIVEKSGVANSADIIAFCDKKLEQLAKKASGSKKSSAINDALEITVLNVLKEQSTPKTVTELLEDVRLKEYTNDKNETVLMSNPKLTSILGKLIDKHKVVRTIEKKRSYFSIAETAEE